MPYAGHQLRDAFEGQGDSGFTAWTYATSDVIERVLAPHYFTPARGLLRVGDLIWLAVGPRQVTSPWPSRTLETRRCLLMVAGNDRDGVRVRLVQDYGRPEDPDAELIPPPRPRGRPRKEAAA